MPVVEKVKFARGQQREFERWFQRELHNTVGDRGKLVTKWKDEIVRWRGKQPEGSRDFPWPGASNLIVPVTAMHTDPVYADLMQTFHAGKDFWHIAPKRPDRVDASNALRELLSNVDRDFLHMRDVNAIGLLHTIVLGTGIYKDTWIDEGRMVRDYNQVGEIEKVMQRFSQPAIQHVPLHYFYLPADAWDIDPDAPVGGARWVAQKFRLSGSQLLAKAQGDPDIIPRYDKDVVNFVLAFEQGDGTNRSRDAGTTNADPIDAEIRAEDDYQPWEDKRIDLFEVWARFDVDDDGVDEDVVVVWHHPTESILRITHNPFLHGKRPFERTRYLQGFGFYGIGTAEADEWSQNTVTKLWNAQIDNVLIANTKMFSVPEGSDVEPGEDYYPGKIWFTPPGEQVRDMSMGDIHASLPTIINMLMQLSESRTGVSELRQGNLSGLPSRTPATSLLSILQEGNKRFDEIMGSMRVPFGRMGLRTLQNLSQWFREDPTKWNNYFMATLGQEDAAKVVEVLSEPVTKMGESFGVEVAALSSISNKEAEKQNFIGMLQVVSQLGSQLIQLAQLAEQMQGTQTGNVAAAMYSGGVELLERLLERFDIQNVQEFLPPPVSGGQPQQQQPGQPIEPQFGQLGGFFGSGPFAQAPSQVGNLIGL